MNQYEFILWDALPNACGQRQTADIGLQGVSMKTSEGMKEAFEIAIGGILGPNAQFNEKLKGRVPAEQVGPVLARSIQFYKDSRNEQESFHQFYQRVSLSAFQVEFVTILNKL